MRQAFAQLVDQANARNIGEKRHRLFFAEVAVIIGGPHAPPAHLVRFAPVVKRVGTKFAAELAGLSIAQIKGLVRTCGQCAKGSGYGLDCLGLIDIANQSDLDRAALQLAADHRFQLFEIGGHQFFPALAM